MDQNIDIYAKAEAELASIDSQMAALEKRRKELDQFVELGRRLFASQHGPIIARLPIPTSSTLRRAMDQAAQHGRDMSMKARILSLCKQYIKDLGRPVMTRELLAHIEANGVEVTGADKVTTISVILSRSDEFKSDRALGWSLIPAQKELTPQDAPTSAGSSTA